MKPQSSPESEVKLLVEDYGTRTGQWLAQSAALTGGTSAPASSRSAPLVQTTPSQNVYLLLDDYGSRSTRWWDGFDKAAAQRSVEAARRSKLPGPRFLLEDYEPRSSLAPKPWADNGAHGPGIGPEGALGSGKPSKALAGAEQGLDVEVEWDRHLAHPRARMAGVLSLAVHTVLVTLALLQPGFVVIQPRDLREAPSAPEITLLAPPDSVLRELTQPAPSKGPLTMEFEGPKETPAPALVFPEEPTPAPPSPAPKPETAAEPEPPKIEVEPQPPKAEEAPAEQPPAPKAAQSPNPDDFRPGARLSRKWGPSELPMPRRSSRPPRPPKLALQDPRSGLPGREGPLALGSLGLNARPGQIVQGAIQNLAASGGTPSRQAVGDIFRTGGPGGYLPPSSGNTGSNLELLSDPKGVDFRPYLIQILAAVRRNWYAVVPESARLGMSRGRVHIQLAIVRNGTVSKLVIAKSSGASALDRAAVAGISASNPFPPLPPDYAGTEVRLQFAFLYNIKR